MRILAIDCGNTRLKIAWFDRLAASDVTALGYADLAAFDALLVAACDKIGQPDRVVISNVAGDEIRSALTDLLRPLRAEAQWIQARAVQCGVTNRYQDPGQLGSDRWAALIGAWGREGKACLVVNAGTATTVDALSDAGTFEGGLILPGFDMMREALASGTAGLPRAAGRDTAFPRNTADAIWSGCVGAQAGAIERMRRHLPIAAPCVLSGGAAQSLLPALNTPCYVEDNLLLEGLARIAMEDFGTGAS